MAPMKILLIYHYPYVASIARNAGRHRRVKSARSDAVKWRNCTCGPASPKNFVFFEVTVVFLGKCLNGMFEETVFLLLCQTHTLNTWVREHRASSLSCWLPHARQPLSPCWPSDVVHPPLSEAMHRCLQRRPLNANVWLRWDYLEPTMATLMLI